MIKVLSIASTNRMRAIQNGTFSAGRRVASAVVQQSSLRLVSQEEFLRERARKQRSARRRRLLRQNPWLVDGVFVTLTLGAAATLWLSGW
jgi:hypothetical protein